MPGKLCNGKPLEQPYVSNARAYCEGMAYRAEGTQISNPITGNPHSATGDPVDYANWNRGWTAADNISPGVINAQTAGCCGMIGVDVDKDIT